MIESWSARIFFSISAMAIVFGVLVFLMFMINVMSVIFKEKKKVVAVKKEEPVFVDETAAEEEETDDCEVVAAIMAALSATLDVSSDKLRIRSIKRVDRRSNWRN